MLMLIFWEGGLLLAARGSAHGEKVPLFYQASSFSDNVLSTPCSKVPPDWSAEITFFAGDCNSAITSPISSVLLLMLTRSFSAPSPIKKLSCT